MSHESISHQDAEEAASLWAARMDGRQLSPVEREELTRWLDESPSHRDLLKGYCDFSQRIEPHLVAAVRRGAISLPPRPAPQRSRWSLALWLSTGLVGAAAAVALLTHTEPPHWEARKVATSTAQREKVTLIDGTRVELSALTSLEIQEGTHERRLRLASGEAYFSVAKDASRPFIVETPSGSVRVTGTVFDVRSQPGQGLEVTVEEGSVQVSPIARDSQSNPAPVMLKANDRLVVRDSNVSVQSLGTTELDDVLAWRNGHVVFDATPLREALERFALYHGRGLIVSDDVANLQIGGRYSLEDLDGFFADLESLLPVEVARSTNGTVRINARSSAR